MSWHYLSHNSGQRWVTLADIFAKEKHLFFLHPLCNVFPLETYPFHATPQFLFETLVHVSANFANRIDFCSRISQVHTNQDESRLPT